MKQNFNNWKSYKATNFEYILTLNERKVVKRNVILNDKIIFTIGEYFPTDELGYGFHSLPGLKKTYELKNMFQLKNHLLKVMTKQE